MCEGQRKMLSDPPRHPKGAAPQITHQPEIFVAAGGDAWWIGRRIVGVSIAKDMVHPNGLSQNMEMVSMERCISFSNQVQGDVGKHLTWAGYEGRL